MKNLGGRPKKVSDNELHQIIDHYYIACAGEDSNAMATHGIFERIAAFAKAHGLQVEARDFRRRESIRQYISELGGVSIDNPQTYTGMVPFDPIDFGKLPYMSRTELELFVAQREKYCKALYHLAGESIQQAAILKNKISLSEQVAEAYKKQVEILHQKNSKLEFECDDRNRLIKLLKSINPERAEEFAAQSDKDYAAAALESLNYVVPCLNSVSVAPVNSQLADALKALEIDQS